ncbi:MAG: SGNH/GDSL hydrolase family protein [Gammaproteobacteria bacterium]
MKFKDLAKNLLALGLGILVSVILAEAVSRIALPVFPGAVKLDLVGNRLDIDFLRPDSVYRQFSEEYDALTRINEKGYRGPAAEGAPDVVFLGDSFTFGVGLSEEETFPFIFCKKLRQSCANLAFPGAGTISELDRFEEFLVREQWRPRHVFLFVLAMTGFLGAGNDLYDNYRRNESYPAAEPNRPEPALQEKPVSESPDTVEALLGYRKTLLRHSNLFRVLKYRFGPAIKQYVSPAADQKVLEAALKITKRQLARLDGLSGRYGFAYDIYLIHPVQDILRGSDRNTLEALRSISPRTVKSTASLFYRSPERFYFPLDGHLNPEGSRKIAGYLIAEFENRPPRKNMQ